MDTPIRIKKTPKYRVITLKLSKKNPIVMPRLSNYKSSPKYTPHSTNRGYFLNINTLTK